MKLKLLTTIFATTAALSSISNAVTVTVAGFANASVGLITVDTDGAGSNARAVASGSVIFVSVTTALTNASISESMNTLLASTTSTKSQFDTSLNSLISGSNTIAAATNPGIILGAGRAFTDGAISPPTVTNREGGSAGNFTYLFLVAEQAGFITGIGAYTGPSIPSIAGTLTFNPTSSNDIGVGTSVLAAATTNPTQPISGFQLAAAIPEPSAALLGAFGALGLLSRRRI